MQFIVDQLFIGNRLATGELTFADGTRVDLRNIASPIIVTWPPHHFSKSR